MRGGGVASATKPPLAIRSGTVLGWAGWMPKPRIDHLATSTPPPFPPPRPWGQASRIRDGEESLWTKEGRGWQRRHPDTDRSGGSKSAQRAPHPTYKGRQSIQPFPGGCSSSEPGTLSRFWESARVLYVCPPAWCTISPCTARATGDGRTASAARTGPGPAPGPQAGTVTLTHLTRFVVCFLD